MELKFRAWDGTHFTYSHQYESKGKDKGDVFAEFFDECLGCEFNLCTGLKDDFGNDIYEEDILQRVGTRDAFFADSSGNTADTLKITTEVVQLKVESDEFGKTSFGYSLHRQATYSERNNHATYKVIGNTYENKSPKRRKSSK